MLGRWQPWHDGHTELFKRALAETGQVCIMVRNVGGIVGEDAGGGRTVTQDDNPWNFHDVRLGITNALREAGYVYATDYVIMQVPNIVDITYGRDVGYSITLEKLPDEIEKISATEIRKIWEEERKKMS